MSIKLDKDYVSKLPVYATKIRHMRVVKIKSSHISAENDELLTITPEDPQYEPFDVSAYWHEDRPYPVAGEYVAINLDDLFFYYLTDEQLTSLFVKL